MLVEVAEFQFRQYSSSKEYLFLDINASLVYVRGAFLFKKNVLNKHYSGYHNCKLTLDMVRTNYSSLLKLLFLEFDNYIRQNATTANYIK